MPTLSALSDAVKRCVHLMALLNRLYGLFSGNARSILGGFDVFLCKISVQSGSKANKLQAIISLYCSSLTVVVKSNGKPVLPGHVLTY